MDITVEQVLERARRRFEPPVHYWLGAGGRFKVHDLEAAPGDPPIDLAAAFEALRKQDPAHAARIEAKAQAAGIDVAPAGPVPACDCSNFSNWVLRIPHGTPDWLNTDAMRADALGGQKVYEPFDPLLPQRAAPGALIVYPKPGPDQFGHVGIVTAVDPVTGLPLTVIHCSAENFFRTGHAIAETGPEEFFEQPKTMIIWCRRVRR